MASIIWLQAAINEKASTKADNSFKNTTKFVLKRMLHIYAREMLTFYNKIC